ncbi:MAG: glycosyltransferase [Chloroflexi bacterium]|nr:MAG: glycosyltransferase [Chloroflexota bacterium]
MVGDGITIWTAFSITVPASNTRMSCVPPVLTMQRPGGLVCAKCRGALRADGEELVCMACRTRYPVIDGIPSFAAQGVAPAILPGCALSVVIPALNEAASLDQVLPAVEAALTSLKISHELVVVDGGSTDKTQEVVRRHGARLVTQKLPGFGGACRAGFEQSRGEYVLTMDADGSHDPSFVGDLWTARGKAEVVIASRYVPGGAAFMPGWRSLLTGLAQPAEPDPQRLISPWPLAAGDGPLQRLPPVPAIRPSPAQARSHRLRHPGRDSDPGPGCRLRGARDPFPVPGTPGRQESRPALQIRHLIPAYLPRHVAAAQFDRLGRL